MKAMRSHIALVGLALAAFALAACSGGDGTKAGGSAAPVTLRIGSADTPGRPGADQVQEFARRVKELSGGMVRIRPVWEPGGQGPDWDQRVARMVARGELDLGMVPARAWDTEGVTSLRALHAPFLVTSEELLARVVKAELAKEMLAGLDELGVVGLALLPEGLRHPFGFDKPLLAPDDYAGRTIRAPTSTVTSAVFEALGATADDLAGNFPELVANGAVAGAETSFMWAPSLPGRAIATGNVTLYPKVNSLVVNTDALARLTEEQRGILQEAATQTREWAIEALPTDEEAARTYCEQGGSIVLASESDLAALERAAAPVYADLERDAKTKRLIAEIRELKAEMPVTSNVDACSGDRDEPISAPEPTGDAGQSIPDGIYRLEIADEDLRAGGVVDPGAIAENRGIFTWTLSQGKWHYEQRAANALHNPSDDGTYTVEGDGVTFVFPPGGPPPSQFRWSVGADGSLRFTPVGDVDPTLAVLMSAHPWKRIADVEAR